MPERNVLLCLPPNYCFHYRQVKSFSELIIRENLSFQWRTFARMDPGFTREVLDSAKKAEANELVYG
jgi:hypothetical protein